ncbi:unnamed protein product [Gordionus sp. m RMFG-2023]|uniref:charged multivesicular body protein 7-like n=1 Tax=Gordionus sp. m RMFG-2023 TaxID=3053472 RepID=UPI0030DE067F
MTDTTNDYFYSPFRSQTTNSKDWDYKMTYWITKIKDIYSKSNDIFINFNKLSEKLCYKGRLPYGINEIYLELIKKEIIIPLNEINSETSNYNSWFDWSTQMIKYPLSYINSYIKIPFINDSFDKSQIIKDQYIYKDNLERFANEIYDTCKHKLVNQQIDSHSFYTLKQVKEACGESIVDIESLLIALKFLSHKGLISIESTADSFNENILVKFTQYYKEYEKPIISPELDVNIVRLKRVDKILENDIDKLTIAIDKCIINAKQHLTINERNKAKSYLKRKILFENQLKKKEAALDNIRELLDQIVQVQSNKMVYDAYKSGIYAYKSVVAKSNIDTSKLNATMDEIQEVVDIQNEIDKALSTQIDVDFKLYPSLDNTAYDNFLMAELEQELNELIKESEQDSDKNEIPTNLYPKIPTIVSKAENITKFKADENEIAYQNLLDDSILEDLLPDIPSFEPSLITQKLFKKKILE